MAISSRAQLGALGAPNKAKDLRFRPVRIISNCIFCSWRLWLFEQVFPRGLAPTRSHKIVGSYPAVRAEALTYQSCPDTCFVATRHCKSPNTATPVGVPTSTLPSITIGVMNLFPLPKLSRPLAAWLLL